VVSDAGEITLEIVEAGDADPDQVARDVESRYRDTEYDFVNEWPIRMAVVQQHGILTHLVSIVCHLVTDGSGAMVMLDEVATRRSTPVTGVQALEQARWQRSPAGQRQNQAALRYWESLLRTVPARRFAGAVDERRPRYWEGVFTSPRPTVPCRRSPNGPGWTRRWYYCRRTPSRSRGQWASIRC